MSMIKCPECGNSFSSYASSCPKCGLPKEKIEDFVTDKQNLKIEDNAKGKNKPKSYICSSCGASLKSFSSECPYCRNEIRDVKVSKNIEDFAIGLEKINNKELPKYESKDSLLKKVVGTNYKEDEAKRRFEYEAKLKRNEEIANYIINYPVPNSKEDLLEFMILATTNLSIKSNDNETIKEAWLKKMDQVYEKAKITLSGSSFDKIKELYNNKKNEIRIKKNKTILYVVFGIIGYFLFLILIVNPWLFFSLFFLLLVPFIYLYKLINNGKIFIFKYELNKRIINYLCIILLVLSFGFGIKGIFFNKKPMDQSEINYYDSAIEKYDVNVDIKFKENLLFNKYDVDIIIYDQKDTLYHGVDKSLEYKLPIGKHKIKFEGDGMSETVELNVKSDTYVKYEISCHEDGISVKEIELEYKNQDKPNKEEINETETFEGKLNNFTKGYEKVSSIDVSEGTRVYFKGTLDKIDVLGDTEGSQVIVGYIKDENNNTWGCILNYTTYVSKNNYDDYINKEVYLRGLFIQKADSDSIPVVNMEKMIIIETEKEEAGIQAVIDSKGEDEVIMYVLPEEYVGADYKTVENEMKEYGFSNIKTKSKEKLDTNNKEGTIAEFTIAGRKYKRGDKFKKTDEILIIYWTSKDNEKNSVSYSTNDAKTVKDGNKGIYSYIKEGNNYDIYYIIDFNDGYVYYFNEGEGNDWCDKLKIKSGNLNSTLLYTYHDGTDTWDEALYFKYKNQTSILVMEDSNHFQHEFEPTNLETALKLRGNKKITSR